MCGAISPRAGCSIARRRQVPAHHALGLERDRNVLRLWALTQERGMPEPPPSAPRSTGLAEALVLWALFGVVAVSIAVTYTRTPVRELYHVTGGGPAAGARAVLGFAGFPAGLM